jgi:uncharacterized membrane protein YozB (DUF420 family)
VTQETASALAGVNAILNGSSALLMVVGYAFIQRRRIKLHAAMMISAIVTSAAFLVCYLTLHYHIGATRFPQLGWIRTVYLLILLTHTVLAAILPVLVAITVYRVIRRQWIQHRRIARWTLPIWLYVSVTGVVIYWMLYHLAPRLTGA